MATEPPAQKAYKVEYAKSGRAACKACREPIAKDLLRVARVVESTRFDGVMTLWFHGRCVFKKPGFIKGGVGEIEGLELLRWEDQQMVKKYVQGETVADAGEDIAEGEGAKKQDANDDLSNGEFLMDYAKSGRSTCKACKEPILKDEVRIGKMTVGPQGRQVPAWRHAACMINATGWNRALKTVPGWSTISAEDQKSFAEGSSTSANKKQVQKDAAPQSKKRKAKEVAVDEGGEEKKGRPKKEAGKGHEGTSDRVGKRRTQSEPLEVPAASKRVKTPVGESSKGGWSEEEQTRTLWQLKDGLQQNAVASELREMLVVNGQHDKGTELELRERCADGMLFGPLKPCPLCQSSVKYSEGMYRCGGYLSAWSKCNFSTMESHREASKWKIPPDSDNEYLQKFKKPQSVKGRPVRLLPPKATKAASDVTSPTPAAARQAELPPEGLVSDKPLAGLVIVLLGRLKQTKKDWKEQIEENGGRVVQTINSTTNCLVSDEAAVAEKDPKICKAM